VTDVTSADRPTRRTLLSLAAVGLAGCAGRSASADSLAPDRPSCAAGFRVVDRTVEIRKGTVPRVAFDLRNEGEASVDYDLRVTFQQRTSLGLAEPTGHTRLTGTLAPGAARTVTATDDAFEVENTTGYRVDATLSCGESSDGGE
jgi:hypothetical protein